MWGGQASAVASGDNFQKETLDLRLDATLARSRLGWKPRWEIDSALRHTIEWYKAWTGGSDMRAVSQAQLDDYMAGE